MEDEDNNLIISLMVKVNNNVLMKNKKIFLVHNEVFNKDSVENTHHTYPLILPYILELIIMDFFILFSLLITTFSITYTSTNYN